MAERIPEYEIQVFQLTVEAADRMAARGELVAGHDELTEAFGRAARRAAQGAVGLGLALRYRVEILAYCERWGVRIG